MKNNDINRIKFLMSYDYKMTLNENEEIFLEDTAKNIKFLRSMGHDIPTLNKVMYETLENLEKEYFALKNAGRSANEINKAFENIVLRKAMVVDNLTEDVFKKIIEDTKIKLNKEQPFGSTTKKTSERKKTSNTKKTDSDKTNKGKENTKKATDSSKSEAINNALVISNKVNTPVLKTQLQKNINTLKLMSPDVFEKFKSVSGKLNKKWLIALGLLGGAAAYNIWSNLENENDTNLNLFDEPVINLANSDDSSKVIPLSTGDPVIHIKKTGVENYDKNGGLIFYPNKRVMLAKTKQMGTWSSNSGIKSNTPIGNIKIVWDGKTSTGSSNTETKKHKITYVKNDSFPIKLGYVSNNVTKLQNALGIKPDGRFGYKTFSAIKSRLKQLNVPYNNQAINQELFNIIINSSKQQATDDKTSMDYYYDQYGRPAYGDKENLKSPEIVGGKENLEKGFAQRKKELEVKPEEDESPYNLKYQR